MNDIFRNGIPLISGIKGVKSTIEENMISYYLCKAIYDHESNQPVLGDKLNAPTIRPQAIDEKLGEALKTTEKIDSKKYREANEQLKWVGEGELEFGEKTFNDLQSLMSSFSMDKYTKLVVAVVVLQKLGNIILIGKGSKTHLIDFHERGDNLVASMYSFDTYGKAKTYILNIMNENNLQNVEINAIYIKSKSQEKEEKVVVDSIEEEEEEKESFSTTNNQIKKEEETDNSNTNEVQPMEEDEVEIEDSQPTEQKEEDVSNANSKPAKKEETSQTQKEDAEVEKEEASDEDESVSTGTKRKKLKLKKKIYPSRKRNRNKK